MLDVRAGAVTNSDEVPCSAILVVNGGRNHNQDDDVANKGAKRQDRADGGAESPAFR